MQVFGSSGVRGVAGVELTPAFVGRIAAAAGVVFDTDAVAVARDTRTTGELFADAAASALASVGCNVHRLGPIPTPAAQFYADSTGVPAVVITASHNPPEYNGVKLVGSDGVELSRNRLEQVEARLLAEDVERVRYGEVGRSRRVEGVADDYVDSVLAAADADRERIADAGLTVALDPGHGAGSLTSPRFFRELGCSVVTVNAQPDGHFPGRHPEPTGANLADLRRLVRTTDADVGIAHDGDADRAVFVDENGEQISGDASFAALTEATLGPGDTAVSAINVSQRVVDVVKGTEADLDLTPIGSTYIISRIRELRARGETIPIAGEGNGGVLFPTYRIARDGAYTATKFLALVAERPASEVVAPHGGYAKRQLNLGYSTDNEREAMLAAAEEHARTADAEPTTTDGFRLDYGDAWTLVRASGTEPLVRVYAEARTESRAEALLEELRTAVLPAKASS